MGAGMAPGGDLAPLAPDARVLVTGARVTGRAVVAALGPWDVRISVCDDDPAAARALGHDLGDELIDFQVERTRPMGPYRTSSMIDFVEGREVEVGPIWREPLRRGQAAGIAMPHTARLLERIEQRLAER